MALWVGMVGQLLLSSTHLSYCPRITCPTNSRIRPQSDLSPRAPPGPAYGRGPKPGPGFLFFIPRIPAGNKVGDGGGLDYDRRSYPVEGPAE
eukprot:767173-Hanusia_phi.AAC.3